MIRSSNNDDFILLLLRWSLPGIGYFAVWIVGSVTVTASFDCIDMIDAMMRYDMLMMMRAVCSSSVAASAPSICSRRKCAM